MTKGGHGIEGVPDWTGEVIRRGVDEALRRLGTDVIDVFLLHACDVGILECGDVVEARSERARGAAVESSAAVGALRAAAERTARLGAAEQGDIAPGPAPVPTKPG